MKKHTNLTLLCTGVLLLIFSHALYAAPPVLLKIFATDNTRTDSLLLGLDPAATNHIDSTLGEEEFPPGGPAFDIRFASNPGPVGKDTCKGGTKVNYHHMVRITQADRWRIAFWSDDSGSTVTFTWQFLNAGANGWTLEDGSPDQITVLPHFPPVDLTTTTSFTYPNKTTNAVGPQYVYINYFDGLKLTTAAQESLTVDAAKTLTTRKAYLTQFQFTVAPAGAPPVGTVALHVEFGDAVTFGPNSIFALPVTGDKGKGKIWNLTNPSGTITPPITITGKGAKGKATKITKWWWLDVTGANVEGKKAKAHTDNITSVNQIFLLREPTWMNVVTEMYAQGFANVVTDQEKGKGIGMRIGVRDTVALTTKFKPIYRWNILPKPGDVIAALWKKKVGGHTAIPGQSFATLLIGGKAVMVAEKKGAITPDKGNDALYAEAIALKFNINASDNYGKMEHSGLGSLIYNKPSSPFNGWTISKFMDTLDHYMSWGSAGVSSDSTAFYAAAHDFNTAFSGPFDTVTFAAKSVIKGVRAVGAVSYLYRASLELPPVMPVASYHEQTPVRYKLEQNYPNPFNPTTKIRFELPQDAYVTLKIYNILGQEVTTLLNHDQMTQGTNEVNFDATRLASGVYYYRLVVNDGQFVQVKKMMLLK
jgi:hypothetical protein